MNKFKKIRNVIKGINKQSGEIASFNTSRLEIPRIKTGSILLDYATSGGIPVGKVTAFWGEKSCGKSTTVTRIAGNAQKLCANCYRPMEGFEVVETGVDPETGEVFYEVKEGLKCDCFKAGLVETKQYPSEGKREYNERVKKWEKNSFIPFVVAYVDIEGTFDPVWAKKLGFDPRIMLYIRPDTAEEAIDTIDMLIRTAEVDMIILDSIAALTPSVEVEESTEKDQMGIGARLLNKGVRKFTSALNQLYSGYNKYCTNLWINQPRQKIGGWGKQTTLPMGKGQGFMSSMEIKMWTSNYNKEKWLTKANKEFELEQSDQVKINFKIEKNKTGRPKIRGSYFMDLQTGEVVDDKLILNLLDKYNYLKKSGSKWKFGKHEFKRKMDAEDYVLKNKDKIKQFLLDKMLTGGFA
mgnify:CR=1 FL=1